MTRGKETFVVKKKTQKHVDVQLLKADKETLKGITLFYISYICMPLLKCLTLFIYCVRVVKKAELKVESKYRSI